MSLISACRTGRAPARLAAAVLALALACAAPAGAQQEAPAPGQPAEAAPGAEAGPAPPAAEAPPPAYDERLLRLSEILGGLYFLRNLCGYGDGPAWRAEMQALLAAEKPSPARRQRFVSRFNYGFETYRSVYRVCTPSATRAIALYLDQGRKLVTEVQARYAQ